MFIMYCDWSKVVYYLSIIVITGFTVKQIYQRGIHIYCPPISRRVIGAIDQGEIFNEKHMFHADRSTIFMGGWYFRDAVFFTIMRLWRRGIEFDHGVDRSPRWDRTLGESSGLDRALFSNRSIVNKQVSNFYQLWCGNIIRELNVSFRILRNKFLTFW